MALLTGFSLEFSDPVGLPYRKTNANLQLKVQLWVMNPTPL